MNILGKMAREWSLQKKGIKEMSIDENKLEMIGNMLKEMNMADKNNENTGETDAEENKIEDIGEIHHNYVVIDYNLRGIITLLKMIEDVYYDGGKEYEDEWQLFKIVRKLIEIEQKEIKVNNNLLDKLTMQK